MCRRGFRAHAGAMFITYDIAKVLVGDHQRGLRRDASERRLGRKARHARHEARRQPPAA